MATANTLIQSHPSTLHAAFGKPSRKPIMLLFTYALLLYLSIGQALANSAAVVRAIEEIQLSTQRLSVAVVKWDGFILTAFPIGLKSMTVQRNTKRAIFEMLQCEPLDLLEALEVGTVSKSLVGDVESLLRHMANAQPKFKKALLSSFVLGQIKTQQRVSEDLFYEVVRKLPKMARGEGQKLQRKVSTAFEAAKREFEPNRPSRPEVWQVAEE